MVRKILMAFVIAGSLNQLGAHTNSQDFLTQYTRNFQIKPEIVQPSAHEPSAVSATTKSKLYKVAVAVGEYFKEPFKLIPPFPVTHEEKNTIIAHQLYNTLQESFTSIIAPSAYRDLNILYNEYDEKCSLFSVFDTNTACGKLYAVFLLANPTADWKVLEKRQAIIRFLVEHEEVRAELKALLQELAEHETVIADFYKSEANIGYTKGILPWIYIGKGIPFLDFMDESLTVDNILYMYDYLSLPLVSMGIAPSQIIGGTMMGNLFSGNLKVWQGMWGNAKLAFQGEKMSPQGSLFVLTHLATPLVLWNDMRDRWNAPADSTIDRYVYFKWLGLTAYQVWGGLQGVAHKKRVFDFIHKKMNKVALIVRALKQFSVTLQSYPELNSNVACAPLVHTYTQNGSHFSPDMKELLGLLETETFKTESQWSLRGRVKTAYHLFEKVKGEMASAFVAIGEIDAYVSAAELVKKYENTDHPFTFAVYEKESSSAVLELQGMWHPLISRDVVIANSVVLGVDGHARNVILTGPNAGGKTTFLKGVATAVLFGQTLGIVPATFLRFTPFGKMNTYVNIVDNIAAHESHFMAEVARASELVNNTQENDTQHIFTFSIIDELFSGAEPKPAQSASYAIAKGLGEIPTSVTLLSTHFVDTMSKLEGDTGLFTNYKVSAEIRPDKTIYYPYTVVPGVSSINVVDAILRNAGLSDKILNDFQEQLES